MHVCVHDLLSACVTSKVVASQKAVRLAEGGRGGSRRKEGGGGRGGEECRGEAFDGGAGGG